MRRPLSGRKYIVGGIFLAVGIIFLVRLLQLQVLDQKFVFMARQNVLRNITQYPARGLVYDRNGELLVYNEAVYDLMVIPRQVKEMDTTLFCNLLDITKEDFERKLKKARDYSPRIPSVFEKQLTGESFAPLQEKLHKFKGFYAQPRSLRKYPKPIAAHVLGYIGEVNDADIKKNSYYRQGDYIGKSGLEKYYEDVVGGRKGNKIVMVDKNNVEQGSYKDGEFDSMAVAGDNLYSTIDAKLQEYAELLMKNKRGSVVAIEPSTGEVLVLLSAPTYDPNLLVGRVRGTNYGKLQDDISKPLFNRALMGTYPPGSIFKIPQAMIGLQMGVITPNTGFPCDKIIGCHNHPYPGNVQSAIKMSCNPYFYYLYKRIILQNPKMNHFKDSQLGLTAWRERMLKFGFGQRLQIDLPEVKGGAIPDTGFYNRWYGENRWSFTTIYSNSIGQGEVSIIPLQMANLAATVANRGYYYTPHLVRYWGDNREKNAEYYTKHETGINPSYFEIAVDGMYGVIHEDGGTGGRARIPDIAVCGKTGTAENIGRDHSVFIAFAPKDNPKIAISVYVENSGFGGTWAAPIASLIIEKYLKGEVERKYLEETMISSEPCQTLPLTPVNTKKRK
ncbi:penicillin-binding protein 2 [Bacteroidales bacterium OttesenSCG-928-C19]|nr:penicillin-binding protein 2 [Bacteroidales bacterium OttesenSCG-928-C19]